MERSVSEKLEEAKRKAEREYAEKWIKKVGEAVKKKKESGKTKKSIEEVAAYKRKKRDERIKRVKELRKKL